MSDNRRIQFWKKRKIERQFRSQLRKDAEIPEQVYRSAGKAYKMILDGSVHREQAEEREAGGKLLPGRTLRPAAGLPVRRDASRHGAGHILWKAACSMAAVLLVCVLVNAAFPAQVRALPIVGSIFGQIQKAVGYDNLSEYARPLEEEGEDDGEEAELQNYTETNGGLSVSVSEVYADSEVAYLSMKLKSAEPFPKDFYYSKENETEKIDGKVGMYMYASKRYSFMKNTGMEFWNGRNIEAVVEGMMVNENTYEFLWRIELASDLGMYRRNVDDKALLPEEFTLNIEIDSIHSLLSREKYYEGPWHFRIPIQVDDSHREIVEIHETGGTGAGLAAVEKTPFEITTRTLTPRPGGYKVVVLDAEGNKLPGVLVNENWSAEAADEMHEKWRTGGYDVSSVEVFVLGKDFYKNIFAAGLWNPADWEGNEDKPENEKLGTLLRQYAEYHKVIRFDP